MQVGIQPVDEKVMVLLALGVGVLVMLHVVFVAAWIWLDAQYRGMRSGWAFALLWLLTNYLGLLVYVMVRGEEPEGCPACGRTISSGFKTCPWCGVGLRGTCASCGAEVEKGWNVCPYCEKPLRATAQPAAEGAGQ